ncbi:hypothetical protein V5109_17590 (plasmid) [Acinetobacter baumannii]|uniref:hypothetical protein n=1 Tax=Acinetobacter nosocomialis TaxID=106654 RepID=UPI0030E36B50
MPLKCSDPVKANASIQTVFSVMADTSTVGKTIYKIENVTLSIFDNGTVLFQGGNNPDLTTRIKQVIGI